jgi:hypothetical protein
MESRLFRKYYSLDLKEFGVSIPKDVWEPGKDIIGTTCSIMWYYDCELRFHLLLTKIGAVVAVIVWYLDLPLPIQSVSITTDAVSLNLDQSEVYNIMW